MNVIREADATANAEHEFGEGAEPRHCVLYIRTDGTREYLLLTYTDLVRGRGRALREPLDVEAYIERRSERIVNRALTIAGIVLGLLVLWRVLA